MPVWDEEFAKEWAVSPRIMELVRRGDLEESSFRNDVSPSFAASLKDGRLLRLWVEHPNKSRRISKSPYRYLLVIQQDFGAPPEEILLESDELSLVLWKLDETLRRGRPTFRLLP